MKNQVIEVLNKEHGKKVIEYWKSIGVNTLGMNGSFTKENGEEERYYGVIQNDFDCYRIEFVNKHNAEIIELPSESPKEEEEKTFPRAMLVSDDSLVWNQSVVVCLQGGWAFATTMHSSVEKYEDALKRGGSVPFYFWKYYKELSDRNKVSKAEIAARFGIPIDLIEIID